LRGAMDHWSSEGYTTASLERALAGATPPADVDAFLRNFQDAVVQLREMSRAAAEADPALASNEVFFDPDRLSDAQQLLERTKLATMVLPGPSGTFKRTDFETGPSNELAVKAADAVISAPGAKYNPLFYH